MLDFDVELSGFDIGEIDFKIEELNSSDEGEPDALATFPKCRRKRIRLRVLVICSS